MGESKLDLLQGTLDLMVLQTLAAMGSLHGYGIARRIEQISGDEVLLNQGTIYASLVRLQQRGWIDAEWGTSENNRKAKFYSITDAGPEAAGAGCRVLGAAVGCDGPGAGDAERRRRSVMGSTEMSPKTTSRTSLSASLRRALHRLRSFFRKEPLDRELNDEMASHIESGDGGKHATRECLKKKPGGRRWFALAECSRRRSSIARRAGCRGWMC